MHSEDDVYRTVLVCRNCGRVFAGRVWADGTSSPIGAGNCPCGDARFSEYE